MLFLCQIFTFVGCRYKHRSFDGARTWIEPAAGTNYHAFNEVFVLGSAQLAVFPLSGLQASVRFHADRLYGDKSGFLHVGYNQNFSVAVTDPDIPFGLRVYENGSIMLPRRAFLQTVSFKSSGKVRCSFTILLNTGNWDFAADVRGGFLFSLCLGQITVWYPKKNHLR